MSTSEIQKAQIQPQSAKESVERFIRVKLSSLVEVIAVLIIFRVQL
uniref:Uncharacterized protein n=1 Tax=uncultured bacterium HF130_01F24 TaxID=710814 RepID=E0XPK9_9BACT|nr:hypothetical protein [uncultured bacterium HF130_01F24]